MVGAALTPAGVPDAHGLGGDAELAGDLGLADAEGEQFGGAQPPGLEPFTFVLGRGAAGRVGMALSCRSGGPAPTPARMGPVGGCRSPPSDSSPARSYAGQPQGQHSDEGSGG
jgi:hypothetical protein